MFLSLGPLSQTESIWLNLALAAVLLLALGWLFYQLRIYRLIEGTPTSQLRSAAQGFVEIEGYCLETAEPIFSPYSGRDCVWYECKTYRKVRTQKSSHWRLIDRQTSPHWFKVADATGDAWVDPRGASVQTQITHSWYGKTALPSSTTGLLGSNYRFTESLLLADSPFYGLGLLQTLDATQLRERQVRDWLRQSRSLGTSGAMYDDKGAGNERLLGENKSLNLLTKPTRWGYPFILSGSSQARTAHKVRLRIALALLICILVTWLLVEVQYAS